MNNLKIAKLEATAVKKLEALEESTGFQIMAYEEGCTFAQPSKEQLVEIDKLEKELGVTLLAYKSC